MKYLDHEIRESGRTIARSVNPLKEACLAAVPDWRTDSKDYSEILGDIFRALRTQYPDEYWAAFRLPANKPRCKDCGRPAKKWGYCNTDYMRHYRAGDIDSGDT